MLEKLKKLKILELSNTKVKDLSALNKLEDLKILNLSNNQIEFIGDLKELDARGWLTWRSAIAG